VNWHLWWLFFTTSFVLDVIPGPAVMLVLSRALRFGWRRTVATVCGILTANGIYFALSATSLGALLLSSYSLFFLVKWIGAAYVVYLGLCALFSREAIILQSNEQLDQSRSPTRLFVDGFLLQMSNPKAFLFFAAILPQFIDPDQPVGLQIALLGITNTISEFIVQTGYAILASRAIEAAREPRFARWTNRISGGLLLAAGGGLAILRRD
jgi:homoserine/homoserine lactone efflux protein